ncbi:hypothetical protein GGS24DRAFT_187046 [Hypoxylon argillaceum]|nr:hypothetical protein GGS24DRAFT_187046 [Hypoxylon argillaceum]
MPRFGKALKWAAAWPSLALRRVASHRSVEACQRCTFLPCSWGWERLESFCKLVKHMMLYQMTWAVGDDAQNPTVLAVCVCL